MPSGRKTTRPTRTRTRIDQPLARVSKSQARQFVLSKFLPAEAVLLMICGAHAARSGPKANPHRPSNNSIKYYDVESRYRRAIRAASKAHPGGPSGLGALISLLGPGIDNINTAALEVLRVARGEGRPS